MPLFLALIIAVAIIMVLPMPKGPNKSATRALLQLVYGFIIFSTLLILMNKGLVV